MERGAATPETVTRQARIMDAHRRRRRAKTTCKRGPREPQALAGHDPQELSCDRVVDQHKLRHIFPLGPLAVREAQDRGSPRCATSRGTRCSTARPSPSPRRAPRDRRCPGEQRAGAGAPDGPCVSGPRCAGMLTLCSCGFGTSVGTDERRRPRRPRSGRARPPARGGSRIR